MTSVVEGVDEFATKELQLNTLERQKIIEFETHLAAASTKVEITEQSSLLLSQLMELKPQVCFDIRHNDPLSSVC